MKIKVKVKMEVNIMKVKMSENKSEHESGGLPKLRQMCFFKIFCCKLLPDWADIHVRFPDFQISRIWNGCPDTHARFWQ
jgi:hypothetical protein